MDEILKQNFSIVISGLSGSGKTMIARQIDKQIKKIDKQQQIKSIFISAKNKIEPEFTSMLKHYQFTKNQKQNLKRRSYNAQIEEVIIIDDFDVLILLLLQNQELLESIEGSFCKAKCKFIYFVNESIKKLLAYQNWIQHESQLNQYQVIQLKKNDVKNHFAQYMPWEECFQNIHLSQEKNNNNIIKSIGQKIQNNYNIEYILIKIIIYCRQYEQEAGNAMMILKELKCNLQNFDFSFIRMKNSSFDFLSLHNNNFEGSQMENVDISKCWFISRKLNNVQWSNMVKYELQFKYNILKNKQAESIVFMNDHQFFIVCFWNLLIELWHIKACKCNNYLIIKLAQLHFLMIISFQLLE